MSLSPPNRSPVSRFTIAAVVLPVLIAANYAHWLVTRVPAYNRLHASGTWYVVELLDKLVVIALVAGALWVLYRLGVRGILNELGLSAPVLPALGFAAIAVSPMLIGFALTRQFLPSGNVATLAFTGLLAPMVEEIYVRGFGFWQLRRRAGWPFWAAAIPQSVLWGLGHVEKGSTSMEVLGILAVLFTGGVVLSWLLEKWENLWVPFCLHAVMNLLWDLFSVSGTALGGRIPFVLQLITMAIAVGITWYRFRPRLRPPRAAAA